MSEEWRPIPGYDGLYEASSLGNIRNRHGKLLSIKRITDWGYRQVQLFKKGVGQKSFRVHRMVCLAFHPIIEGKAHVNHIDGDKLNNRADNLEWMSKRENEEHAGRLGRHHAATNPKRGWKLTVADVIDIRTRKAAGESGTVLADEYGVSNGYLYKVCRGTKRLRG